MILLENLFGNQNIEKILFVLNIEGKCYAKQLSDRFGTALNGFQQALRRLERGGVLVSLTEGRTRIYMFNPVYPFLKELRLLTVKAYEYVPQPQKEKYYEPIVRTRPRRAGKPGL